MSSVERFSDRHTNELFLRLCETNMEMYEKIYLLTSVSIPKDAYGAKEADAKTKDVIASEERTIHILRVEKTHFIFKRVLVNIHPRCGSVQRRHLYKRL